MSIRAKVEELVTKLYQRIAGIDNDELGNNKMSKSDDPNTYEGQAKILLRYIDNEESLIHWIFEQDFFCTEEPESVLDDTEIIMELTKAGGDKHQIEQILKVVHQEDNDTVSGITLITEERKKQIEKHGYDIEHDKNENPDRELLRVVCCILEGMLGDLVCNVKPVWPPTWNIAWYCKFTAMGYKEKLILLGALIAAEIDRFQALDADELI